MSRVQMSVAGMSVSTQTATPKPELIKSNEVVRLDQGTLNRSKAERKKAAMELVFNKFDGLLKNLA